MEAFQLRLWDGRLGRWLSPDPYGQYSSPYLGMGNNPIGMIDPDGGWADCPKCPTTGSYSYGDTFATSEGTYVHSGTSWSSMPEVYVGNNSSSPNLYGNFDYTNDLLSTSFEMGILLGNTDKYVNALKNNKFICSVNGVDKLWSMNYYGGGRANISSFSVNQAKLGTQILGNVGTGLKYAGNILAVAAVVSNEAQYREGLISKQELYKGRIEGAAGFVTPVASLGIAPGNYLGKKYHKEITHDIVHHQGFSHKAAVKFLNFFGIPASSEQAKNGF